MSVRLSHRARRIADRNCERGHAAKGVAVGGGCEGIARAGAVRARDLAGGGADLLQLDSDDVEAALEPER